MSRIYFFPFNVVKKHLPGRLFFIDSHNKDKINKAIVMNRA